MIPNTNDIAMAGDNTTPGLFFEANAAFPNPDEASLNDLSFFSYFAGPNGSNSITFNAYGRGEASGANRIFGTDAVGASNVDMNDFKGVSYFYDNSASAISLTIANTLAVPTPPVPPDFNDFSVTLSLDSSSGAFQYATGSFGAIAGNTTGPNNISNANSTPIIFRGYWEITIQALNPGAPSCEATLAVNGVNIFAGENVAGGGNPPTVFDYGGFGTVDVDSYNFVTGLNFELTLF